MLSGAFCRIGIILFWELAHRHALRYLKCFADCRIFILFSVVLKVDEFVTGVGLNMFSVGLTTYLLRQIFKVKGAFTDPGIYSVPKIRLLS